MPDLPGPPDHYDEAEREAWYQGAATVADILGQQGQIIAGVYEDHTDGDEAGDERCPECGGDLVDGFGGARCADCGYHDYDHD